MTLDELATFSGDKLKSLSDKELEDILKPYFTMTRPELQVKKKVELVQPSLYLSPQKQKALELLKDEGMDMSFLKRKFKR